MMLRSPLSVAGLFALSLGAGPASAQVITVHRLPAALVAQAMTAAVNACAAKGYRISVAVVDADGVMQGFLRSEGAGVHTVDNAYYKAYTAVTYGRPSSEVMKAGLAPDAPRIAGVLPHTILAPGGLPIKIGEETVAAISSSGAPGPTSDEPCAQAGIDAIKDRLR